MCVCIHACVCACMKHLELSFLRCLVHFAIPSKKKKKSPLSHGNVEFQSSTGLAQKYLGAWYSTLLGVSMRALTHKVRPTLVVSGTTPQASSPSRYKKGKWRKSVKIRGIFSCLLPSHHAVSLSSRAMHRFPVMMNGSLWNNSPK